MMRIKRPVKILLLLLAWLPFILVTIFLLSQPNRFIGEHSLKQRPEVAGDSTTMIYVSPSGTSSGNGTSDNPLDLKTGNSRMSSGDTMILKDGIYSLDTATSWLFLGPSNATSRTTIKADTNARPIITDNGGHSPNIRINNFVRVEGIWFGAATKDTAEYIFQNGNDVELTNSTLFNYYGGLNEGASTRNKYIGNRFINSGNNNRGHSIYINNMMAKPGEGALIEKNIYIGKPASFQGGYATHLWHNPGYVTVHNNFYGDVCYGIVVQGKGNIVQDDILWSSGGWQNVALWLPTDNEYWAPPQDANNGKNVFTFRHNLLGPNNANRLVSSMSNYDPQTIIDNNYFIGISTFGNNPKTQTLSDIPALLGVSGADLDTAITNIKNSFNGKTLQQIHDDQTLEANFNTIKIAQAKWSGTVPTLIPTSAPSGEDDFFPTNTPTPTSTFLTPTPTSTSVLTPTPVITASPTLRTTPTPNLLLDKEAPSQPTKLVAFVSPTNWVKLTWNKSSDNKRVEGYWIIRNGITIDTTSETSYIDKTVFPVTEYQYQVVAYDISFNSSQPSSIVNITTSSIKDTEVPAAVGGLQAQTISYSQINLSWREALDNKGVKGYEIYRDGTKIAFSSTTSFGDGNLQPATSYTYQVRTVDINNNSSELSSSVQATTAKLPLQEIPSSSGKGIKDYVWEWVTKAYKNSNDFVDSQLKGGNK